ncbi:MAG: GntR family transcriptional regulator [Chloroflexi bacterium]|nr:GntR family transcriptional regulator [Chloroflexota bacterium]
MVKTLNRNVPLPLYYQLREALREAIEQGEFSDSNPLPTEDELMREFQVSRTTVREALRGLMELGIIVKKQGVGSFVASEKISEILPGLVSFSTEMKARGFSVRTKVMSVDVIQPPLRVIKALDLSESDMVLRVKRLRFVDDKPIVISTSYLNREISPDDNFEGSLYELLEKKYGVEIFSGEASIEACLADEMDAQLLNVDVGSALLSITWRSFTNTNKTVEYSEAVFRGDSYRYIVKLKK